MYVCCIGQLVNKFHAGNKKNLILSKYIHILLNLLTQNLKFHWD